MEITEFENLLALVNSGKEENAQLALSLSIGGHLTRVQRNEFAKAMVVRHRDSLHYATRDDKWTDMSKKILEAETHVESWRFGVNEYLGNEMVHLMAEFSRDEILTNATKSTRALLEGFAKTYRDKKMRSFMTAEIKVMEDLLIDFDHTLLD